MGWSGKSGKGLEKSGKSLRIRKLDALQVFRKYSCFVKGENIYSLPPFWGEAGELLLKKEFASFGEQICYS